MYIDMNMLITLTFSNSEEFCSSSTMIDGQAGWPWISFQRW